MREVRLYGELGRQFGRVHYFAIANAAEAIRALSANFPKFQQQVLQVAERYRVIVGRRRLSEAEELHDPSGDTEVIRIIPVVRGAKRIPWTQIIIGAALIAAGGFPILGEGAYLLSGLAGSVAVSLGTSLVLGGVAQMLAPVPTEKSGKEAEDKSSYVFSGPVNVSAQGAPVPIGYGRLVIGSAVISAGLTTREVAA